MRAITAATRLFPIVGAPITGVYSPPAFNNWFKDHNLDCRMVALEVPVAGFADFVSLLRRSPSFLGCSVTYPHKQAAFAAVDARTARAERLGALNTIRRDAKGQLCGDATDGAALCAALEGVTLRGASVRILGAGGGAGQAIADALCAAGVSAVGLEEHDQTRHAAIARLVDTHWPDVARLPRNAPADILVNATTLGKSDEDRLPFDTAEIAHAQVVCDAVPGETALIRAARAGGLRVVTGADMGAGQLPAQLGFLGLWSA